MRTTTRFATLALLLAAASPAVAQPDGTETTTTETETTTRSNRKFGMEFEFAGNGNRIVSFESMPWENYERLMRVIVENYGGNPEDIRRIDFEKETSNLERYPSGKRNLFRAEWTDPQGRKWMIEPEFVASSGYDGYELVTPPMTDAEELKRIHERIRDSGLVREGLKSGVHLTLDGSRLIGPNGNARALANFIMLHENAEPMLRRMFNPVRGGGHANRFARSLAVDHPDLLEEIDRLRPEERTRENLERIFNSRNAREAEIHEVNPTEDPNSRNKPWKYRSMNLAKMLNVNSMHNGNSGVVEFRMFDLEALSNPENHRLQVEFYRKLMDKAVEMAERGETVRYQPRAEMPAGENPSVYNTPENPNEAKAKARELIESVGMDPREFEPLLEERIKHRDLRTETEFRRALEALPDGRVTHNGRAFTYGFELEGSGEGFARIARPKNPEVNARWDAMTDTQKYEYYRSVVGTNRSSVPTHFDLDLQRFPWLDPNWKVEGTGNWEIRSLPVESIREATDYMREVKRLTGKSGKGFHLHMRDNGADWNMLERKGGEFADFIERSSNWIWLERARRLGTMTAIKSWSNARMSTTDVENVSNIRSSSRATVRVTVPSNRDYIDIEIRGFTKYVDDIENLSKIYTEGLRTGNFGPWKHTDNVLVNGGSNNPAPESLRFVDHMERYLREVEGKEMTPEMRRVIDGLQHEYHNKAKGRARTTATNVATPFLPWEAEASLDESLRRDLKFSREDYVRSLRHTANKVMNGEYGLDLSVASEKALMEHLGLSEAEARALIEYRRQGGKLETAEDVARALATGPDGARFARLNALDLSKVDAAGLAERTGLSEAEARDLIEFRNSHDVTEALERAGVNETRMLEMIDRSIGLDLGTAEATPERIAEMLGISEETARRIVAFRDAHEVDTLEKLREAGFSEAEAKRLLRLNRGVVNLNTATVAELVGLGGMTRAEAEKLVAARGPKPYQNYNDLRRAGVSQELIESLRNNRNINLNKLNAMEAHELTRLQGSNVSWEDARKIVEARKGPDLSSESTLKEILGPRRGPRVLREAKGFDLTRATVADLEARGISSELANRLVNHRDAHRVGRGSYTWSDFNAERAAIELKQAGVLTEAEAERVRLFSGEMPLEKASAEALRERFGLNEAEARAVVRYRDSHKLDRAGLIEAGLSEARADKLIDQTRQLDPRAASITEMSERTGLSPERLTELLASTGLDLNNANESTLRRRLRISKATAAKILEARRAGKPLNTVQDLRNAGLSRQVANKVWARSRGVDLGSATMEELTRAGMSEQEARRIVEVREKARNAEGLNYDEISKQVRFKVKKWARENQLSEALMRSLLPRPNPETTRVVSETAETETNRAAGEGFGRVRRGAAGEFVPSRVSYDTVSSIFEGVKEAGIDRTAERIATAPDAETKAAIERGARGIGQLGLEIVETNRIIGEHANGKVRVSTGLLNEIYNQAETAKIPVESRGEFRMRVLGLIMGHEVSHAGGVRAERMADMEAIRIMERTAGLAEGGAYTSAEIKAAINAFDKPTGSSRIDNFLNRVRNLLKYGTTRGRVTNLERAARGEADPLAKYRRSDGTLKWRNVIRDRALHEGAGLAHFGLALFLKEVALVAATGDRARIEEFFEGLMTTDFYKHYGLFVAGARVGEVAYTRYLQRYVKPGFVNGMLKTNLVLAAGIALPLIVEGQFEGKTFAISVASLGLSSAAVKGGVAGIKWVMDLKKARDTGALARVGVGASRLAKFGGWFYTAVELAVVLYIAEELDMAVNDWLDRRKAKADLADASEEFLRVANDPNSTAEEIKAAADKYHEAWIAYRNFLYGPLHQDEAIFAQRLEGVARRAKIKADERKAALDRIKGHAALRANIERRYGSLDNYAASLVRRDEGEIEADVNTYVDSYNMNREKHLQEVYEDNVRGSGYLDGVENLDWLLSGGSTGAAGDPYGSRSDIFASWGRDRARSGLRDALTGVSENRLEAYDDESALLAAVSQRLRSNGRTDVADVLDDHRVSVLILKEADKQLIQGNGVIDTSDRAAIAERIKAEIAEEEDPAVSGNDDDNMTNRVERMMKDGE